MPRSHPAPRDLARLRGGAAEVAAGALRSMEQTLPWFQAMPPQERSWVGLVAQAGVAGFIGWYADPDAPVEITADVFGTAPRELTRSVTLGQTLQLVRTIVDAVEERVDDLASSDGRQQLREAVLRYSRDVAFAAAEVYARAAEARGAWDARLEALVVDALLRGESDDGLRSRAAALGWGDDTAVIVVVGSTPGQGQSQGAEAVVDDVRRTARERGGDALVGVQGDRLVVVLGDPRGAEATTAGAAALVALFGPGPVVVGPVVTGLPQAHRSARAALSGFVAARGWPGAPRPVTADDLLPERAFAGDALARRALVDRVYRPLVKAGGDLLDTVTTYLDEGASLEATARAMFVHPNTVRYRLRRVTEICGWSPTQPRERFVVAVALSLGRLAGSGHRPEPPATEAGSARDDHRARPPAL